jgi:hypothetical protein
MKANITFLLSQMAEMGRHPGGPPQANVTTIIGQDTAEEWLQPSSPGD